MKSHDLDSITNIMASYIWIALLMNPELKIRIYFSGHIYRLFLNSIAIEIWHLYFCLWRHLWIGTRYYCLGLASGKHIRFIYYFDGYFDSCLVFIYSLNFWHLAKPIDYFYWSLVSRKLVLIWFQALVIACRQRSFRQGPSSSNTWC